MIGTAAERLIADVQAALPGDLAPFSRGLLAAAAGETLRADELLLPPQVDEIMTWLAARLGTRPDRRAALSIWAGWHFRCVLPPLMTAAIVLDAMPRLDLRDVRFVISADLRAERIVIPAALDAVAGEGPERFAGIVDGYLAPLIGLLSPRAGITERVLWSNAGHVFEGFLGMLPPLARERPGHAAALRLLAAPRRADGERNPLFEPVRYVEGRRMRRVCCLRYRFPDGKTCGPCPLNFKDRRSARNG